MIFVFAWAALLTPLVLLPQIPAVAAFYDNHPVVSVGLVLLFWVWAFLKADDWLDSR